MTGKNISHYKILEKIGEGGMGIVYKAEDTQLHRIAALKFLPPHIAQNPEEKARFLHEAQSASALNHSNITTIYGIEETTEGMFLAMEYVEGRTLKQIIDKDSLAIKKILEIAIQICEGLNAAHKKEIVHRDIKSDNIMVTKEGQVKIMDFGLAKLRGASRLTKVGTTLGTAAYMSPEQAQGEEVDQRTDIFSFGVVLYELLTGQLPFKGEHHAAIIYSILNEEPQPVARFNNKVSPELERIAFKTLAKDREERYQHIDDLVADLRREKKSLEYVKTATLTQPVETQKRVKKKALPLVLGGVTVLILVVGYFAFFNKKQPVSVTSGKPSIAVLYLQNLSENKEDEYFASGMTEDIITQLSKISGLRVLSRSDVEEFKGKTVKLREVADNLKVNYVMEGSVRKYGDKVRIACQLIKASDGFHVWADSYDRQMEDLFAIQADVAKEVAKALEVTLAPADLERVEKRPTENIQAYNYYLQGREYYFGGATSKEGLGLAIKMFEKALEADSNFALAYAGLSDCYSSYVMFEIDPKRVWLDKAEKTGRKALALDPSLAEAYRALSRVYRVEGKLGQAIQEAEQAVKDNPNYGEAWRLLGEWYTQAGRYPEAEKALLKALDVKPTEGGLFRAFLNLYSRQGNKKKVEEYFNQGIEIQPTNADVYTAMSFHLSFWGELEEAKKMSYKALSLDPLSSGVRGAPARLMQVFLITGQADSASHYLDRERQNNPGRELFVEMGYLALMKGEKRLATIYLDSCIQHYQPLIKDFEGQLFGDLSRSRTALAYALKGETSKALEQVNRVRKNWGDSLPIDSWLTEWAAVPLSFVYSLTGQREKAVQMLDLLIRSHTITPAYIKSHPFYKSLAGYPAFEALLKRGA